MGTYTKNLFRKKHHRIGNPYRPRDGERLVEAAIIRHDACHAGFRSHAQIRGKLGDEHCSVSKPGDREGFLTSTGRFVDRAEAMLVGEKAGQCQMMRRELLSSDINW